MCALRPSLIVVESGLLHSTVLFGRHSASPLREGVVAGPGGQRAGAHDSGTLLLWARWITSIPVRFSVAFPRKRYAPCGMRFSLVSCSFSFVRVVGVFE